MEISSYNVLGTIKSHNARTLVRQEYASESVSMRDRRLRVQRIKSGSRMPYWQIM